MNDPRFDPDVPPDPAALDELVEAFGLERPPPPADPTGDATAPIDDLAAPPGDGSTGEVGSGDDLPGGPVDDAGTDRATILIGAVRDHRLPPGSRPGEPDEPVDDEPRPTIVISDITGALGAVPEAPAPPLDVDGRVERATVTIGDQELPDALYMEGSLEGGREGPVVLIEDDDTADTMMPESASEVRRTMEPRLRDRRDAVKKARRRKRWLIGGGIAAAVLVAVAALAVLGSSVFAIRADQVEVTGVVYTDPQRLQEILDGLIGTPALLVDTAAIEDELEAIPWVESARVRVAFPHAATIDVRERAAVATYQGPDGRYRVLDRNGRVLDVIGGYPFAYVLLRVSDAADLEPGQTGPPGYVAASELARTLTPTVRGHVTEIEVTADGSRLVMWLDDGTEVYFGEGRDLLRKLIRLETVLRAEPDREPGRIDVSTDEVTL